jgi:hypothetical protein
MSIYALWNNKGGVGKSYLTFQIACEYARQHPDRRVLVIDVCPQANSSSMLLGGIIQGENALTTFANNTPLRTISGYIQDRIRAPYDSPRTGGEYATQVHQFNPHVPRNVYLVVGDEQLELQAPRVVRATIPGPDDAWRVVHSWFNDLIDDIKFSWNNHETTVFLDCNPSFSIYTSIAMATAQRLIVPFSADGSSKRAVRAVLSLVYGVRRNAGSPQSEFFLNTERWNMRRPSIYAYVGNRLTQMNSGAASAFKTVVTEIGDEIFSVWQQNANQFAIHPAGAQPPRSKLEFRRMFQAEVNDANSASVVSGALGIPMSVLTSGTKNFAGRRITVNQSQLDKQQPNIRSFVQSIE